MNRMAIAMVAALGLIFPLSARAQASIHGCVDRKGGLRIVAPGTSCGPKETLLTWPAEPEAPVAASYYHRERIFTASAGLPQGAILLCDDPADVAITGGYAWDPPLAGLTDTSILQFYGCRQSGGRCAGGAGEDGWFIVAYSPTVSRNLTFWLTCATAAPAP